MTTPQVAILSGLLGFYVGIVYTWLVGYYHLRRETRP